MPVGSPQPNIETVADRIKLLQKQGKYKGPNYENVFPELDSAEAEAQSPQTAIPIAKVTGKPLANIDTTPGSPGSGSPRTKLKAGGISASIQAKQEALRQAATFKKQSEKAVY